MQTTANFNIYNKKTYFEVYLFIKLFNQLKGKTLFALGRKHITCYRGGSGGI